jgi:DsbC/DsbD-like thiol-disulfide interchange protein
LVILQKRAPKLYLQTILMQVRKNILKLILPALILLFANNVFAAKTGFKAPKNGEAKSRIIASFYQESGQKKLIAGFQIELGDGWTIYAPDDSGFGIAPSFDFEGSENINISKALIYFPKSYTKKENFGESFIEYEVYQGKATIPFEIAVVDLDKKTSLEIQVT